MQAVYNKVLHDGEEAARNVLSALCKLTEQRGIIVDAVKLKNMRVDESLIRAMGRHAEAKRLRKAKIINANGVLEASRVLAQAGHEFGHVHLIMLSGIDVIVRRVTIAWLPSGQKCWLTYFGYIPHGACISCEMHDTDALIMAIALWNFD